MIDFKAITEHLKSAGENISKAAEKLEEETNSQIGKIDDTCKSLPPFIYTNLESQFVTWKAFTGRSIEDQKRIGELLKLVGEDIEKKEKQEESRFPHK